MTVMSVTDFKTNCLRVLKEMQRTTETVLLTKHGKPVAKVVPAVGEEDRPWEALRGTAHFSEKGLFSEDDVWEDT